MAQPPPPHERTMSELTAPEFTCDSLCIQYPEEEVPYVLKIGLIHLLPNFYGLASEDPCKHLKQFHVVCSTMKPTDIQEDHVYSKAFPHSLEGNAKDWLYYLAPRSITSWDDLKKLFLAKFFPASRSTAIRKEFLALSSSLGRASTNTGRGSRIFVQVAPTIKSLNISFYNIFMKSCTTWIET